MILGDRTIRQRIDSGDIGIDPEPSERQIQPASLDIRMGTEIYNAESDCVVGHDQARGLPFTIEPGVPYLGSTLESVSLPDDLAAQLSGRSSLGRLFVTIHQTAGWLDPGWSGEITTEIMNLGAEPQEIAPGDRIGQLVFFPTDRVTGGYGGQYQHQSGPTQSGGL